MEYVLAGLLLLIILIVRSRVVMKRKARDFVFEVALPSIIVKQFPDKEIGFIGAYIFAHQHDMFDDFAINHMFGPYGARIALARLNFVQGISNSDEILDALEGVTGEELLTRVREIILDLRANCIRKPNLALNSDAPKAGAPVSSIVRAHQNQLAYEVGNERVHFVVRLRRTLGTCRRGGSGLAAPCAPICTTLDVRERHIRRQQVVA